MIFAIFAKRILMPRYFIKLAYCGTAYHGWQSQQNAHSVQDEVEKCLALKTGQFIRLTGCGRTDTGVHAKAYFAHFDVEMDWDQGYFDILIPSLNAFLPQDIVVYEIFRVNDEVNARFDAISRTYQYYINREKDPFSLRTSLYVFGNLDMEKMQVASDMLTKYQDFTSFSKLHSKTKTNNCRITEARWETKGTQWIFTITADRFLRNMVRAIVGTLIEAGQGKLSIKEFQEVIEAKNRAEAGFSVPAHGLFLFQVVYPENIRKNAD